MLDHKFIAPIPNIGHEINGVLASEAAKLVYRQPVTSGGGLLPLSLRNTLQRYERFDITNGSNTLWMGMYSSQPINTPDTRITRAVIVLHGRGLDAAQYQYVVQKTLKNYLGKVIVITPFFQEETGEPGQIFWSGNSWAKLGKSSSTLPFRISSGGVLDNLISRLYSTFANIEMVIIAGHSAGGQLANRYSACSSDARNRFLVSAPSSYLYPGNERTDWAGGWMIPTTTPLYDDYKYGVGDLSSIAYVSDIGKTALTARLKTAKVHYLVGALDNDPEDSSMDLTEEAKVQGSTRVERQKLYGDYLTRFYGV
jgi:hypothetical protein